ncbi:MAG: sensor histidine kinase [Nocardioidaceae bacterium]|nr:sensor histidine kinase [Nocardioidaceae bacterium]
MSTGADAPPTTEPPRPWMRTVVGGIWLAYLGNPLGRVLGEDGWARVAGVVLLVVFAAVYLGGLLVSGPIRRPPRRGRELALRGVVLVVLVACTALLVPIAGDQALTCLVFVAALSMGSLPVRWAWVTCGALFVLAEASLRLVPGWQDNGNGLAVVLATLAVWGFRVASMRQDALVVAERELAELTIEEERSRIARDLHDILGHSLTVVTVKAELAQRMLDVDLDRARRELVDLERLSRDALADVRQTALGVRGVSLPAEIASARSALESAGITPDLPTVAEEVPSRYRDLYAWTVREAVTNVVRHSGASRCSVTVSSTGMAVEDDGVGADHHADPGHGLDGLRQRARLAGAHLSTGPGTDGRGFRLTLDVPR